MSTDISTGTGTGTAASASAGAAPGSGPLLVALGSNAAEGRALWQAFEPAARAAGLSLLVPLFEPLWGSPLATRRTSEAAVPLARDDVVLSAVAHASRLSGCQWSHWCVLGHAWGATLAHRLARRERRRVAALALSSAPWYPWLADGPPQPAAPRALPIGVWVAGPGRALPARSWVMAQRHAARRTRQPCDISLSLLPGADLDGPAADPNGLATGLVDEVMGFFTSSLGLARAQTMAPP